MEYRQIVAQNKLAVINYFNIDSIKTETNINNSHYIYAQMKSGDKIWLGTYPSIGEIKEVLTVLVMWLSDNFPYGIYEEYSHCSYETFIMPQHTINHRLDDKEKDAFSETLKINELRARNMVSKPIGVSAPKCVPVDIG